ncbi:LANO_0G05578g1_1 [Lachancea nothofagi CBS 11611]|uniref:LANO_0G05578g1_1 n=1 Tax=Lachancea nothofagi CBS 11611 TaxID=1266666 RepID=A0A1G4KGZ2_9SACH|nr:LANO_0G05578g1_1 [Lachancea nothofagi CBS 11611]
MPSKNSINRPKQQININRRTQSLAKKRDAMEKAGLLQPARSAESSKSGLARSVPIDLYKGEGLTAGPLTTKTLSKKRAKKIERNLKYAEQRKLLVDVQKKSEDSMELDQVKKIEPTKTPLERVKAAFFKAMEDTTSSGLVLENGSGTTLGGPFFP